jgi:hypothetical protein
MRRYFRNLHWKLFIRDWSHSLEALEDEPSLMRDLMNEEPVFLLNVVQRIEETKIDLAPIPTELELKAYLINRVCSDPNPWNKVQALRDITEGKYWIENGKAFIGAKDANGIPRLYLEDEDAES